MPTVPPTTPAQSRLRTSSSPGLIVGCGMPDDEAHGSLLFADVATTPAAPEGSPAPLQTSSRSASPWPPPEQVPGGPGPPAVSAQLVHHRADDAPAARADRMAERDGAAVHVHVLLVGAEQPRRVERDRRERLVDLDALHVVDRLPRLLARD